MDEEDILKDDGSISDWSGSITPPVLDSGEEIEQSQCVLNLNLRNDISSTTTKFTTSHLADITGPQDCLQYFSCENGNFNQKGSLQSGVLQKLFDMQELHPRRFKDKSLKLFGIRFPVKEGLMQPYHRKLFLSLRQHLNTLANMVNGKNSLSEAFKSSCEMQEYVMFLAYIQQMLHRKNHPKIPNLKIPQVAEHQNIIASTLRGLKTAVTSLGRIQGISPLNRGSNATEYMLEKSLSVYFSHVVLDMNWNYIVTLSQLCLRGDFDNTTTHEYIALLEEHCSLIIRDLVTIASRTFSKILYIYDDEWRYFPCPCCKELWILLIHLLDGLAAKTSCQAFWTVYSSVVSSILSSSVESEMYEDTVPRIPCKDPLLFTWWFLRGIAPLYAYDNTGNRSFKEGMYLPGNWLLVQDLLRATFKSKKAVTDEKLARASIGCCLKLATIWSSSSDVIAFLWDYFHKRMNERFLGETHGVLSSTIPCISSLQWMQNCSNQSSQAARDENATSFDLFLKLLAVSLKKSSKRAPHSQVWGQIKGRFYSKFHKKRMEELTDIGLKNFISLFLVLESCIENEDIAHKMNSFLNLIHPSKITLSMSTNLIKGIFAMQHVLRRKKVNPTFLTQKLVREFQYFCREYADRQKDPMSRRNYWQLINLYFENVEEIFSNEDGLENEAVLIQIGDSLSIILSNGNASEVQRVFSFVYCLLSSPRLQTPTSTTFPVDSKATWSSLYLAVLKPWNDKQLVQQIPESFADVFAAFTLLSINCNDSNTQNKPFGDMFVKFCTSDIPARFTAKYLCHLLNSTSALERIVAEDHQPLVINAWLKCILNLTDKSPFMVELTRGVSNLPEVSSLVGGQNLAQPIEKLAFSVILALGNKALLSNSLADMMNLRKQAAGYFGNILKHAESFLQTGNPADSLRLVYSVIGKIVKHCSKIIYSKTSPDCLLPRILDQMVLPLQSSKKVVPQAVTQCLIGHIHQFLSGLANLDFKRDEYVRRKIKEIFNRYFLTTTKRCNASPNSKNPFLVALQNSFVTEPSVGISDFRQFVVDIIAENFLVLPQPPENHSTVLYFIYRLFQKTQCNSEIVRNSPALVMQIMCSLISCDACKGNSSEPPGIRKPAMEILTFIAKANNMASAEARKKLQDQLQNVLMLNVPQFQGIAFKSFEALGKLDSKMAAAVIPTAKESVRESERARGCGEDKNLRRALENFISGIGR